MHFDLKLQQNIEEFGWQVTLIPADDEGPAFAFTTGLFHSFQHPEVLMMGLNLESLHQILNDIGALVKQGHRFEDGQISDEIIEDDNCTFRTIEQRHYREYLGSAIAFYKNEDFPALQCFWPDREGRFPWDANFDERFQGQQELLWE